MQVYNSMYIIFVMIKLDAGKIQRGFLSVSRKSTLFDIYCNRNYYYNLTQVHFIGGSLYV